MPLIAMPGIGELILIFGVVLLLFGGKKLPQLGGAVGESIKNFKKGVKDDDEEAKKLASTDAAKKPEDNKPIHPS